MRSTSERPSSFGRIVTFTTKRNIHGFGSMRGRRAGRACGAAAGRGRVRKCRPCARSDPNLGAQNAKRSTSTHAARVQIGKQ
eukprot:1124737-Pleurochrysis_carterae.AAC.1